MTREFEEGLSRLHESICSLSARHQLELTFCLDGFIKQQREGLDTSHAQQASIQAPSEHRTHGHHPSTPCDTPPTVRPQFLLDGVKVDDTSLPGAVIGSSHPKDTAREPSVTKNVVSFSWLDKQHLRTTASPSKDALVVKTDDHPDSPTGSSSVKRAGSFTANKKRRRGKTKKADLLFASKTHELQSESWLHRLTTHRCYESFSTGLILANAAFIGWQTQFMAQRSEDDAMRGLPLEEQEPTFFFVLQILFCISFTTELGLRWTCDGFLNFFRTAEVGWNVLDVFIVSFGILDTLLEMGTRAAQGEKPSALSGISVLRVLRIVRVVRVARVIRVMRFFKELRMMVYSILGSMKSLLWVLLVLNVMFYLFGLTFTNAVNAYLNTTEKHGDPDNEGMKTNFGTVDRGILSLFMAMSGGNDWTVYYEALLPLPYIYRLIFLLFIIFATFAVANIVTGVFVESAIQCSKTDRDVVVHEEMEAKRDYLKQMQQIFEEMDEDDAGTISFEEFESKLGDERVIAYFSAMKLDASDALVLFRLLDFDHSDEISIDEFVVGCYKLQGESRSLDMKIMQYEVRYLQEAFGNFAADIVHIKDKLDEQASQSHQAVDGTAEDEGV